MLLELNKALKDFNTFHIDAQAEKFICIDDEKSLLEILEFAKKENERIHFIGGGSNILLTQNIDGITVLNQLKGISIINKNDIEPLFVALAICHNVIVSHDSKK